MLKRPARIALTSLLLSPAGCGGLPAVSRPVAPSMDLLTRPGISRELAAHRATTLSDVAYELALDLTRGDNVPGSVTIAFQRRAGAADLVVDFRGLELLEVRANGAEVSDFVWSHGHVVIPRRYLKAGGNAVHFRFLSSAAPAGASIIRFTEPAAPAAFRADSYLYTLLVPADAHQLFPSFDQPDLKAVFQLELVAPAGARVLSNSPLAERVRGSAGSRLRFAPTLPMSTYLFSFAAGPWQVWDDAPPGELPIALYARRSRASEVDAEVLIETHRRALAWLEGYFEVPYPFGKLDFLLAPAFPFGGMEHPGAVFYNESRFVFREPPTLSDRLARDATLYHEVAHQWFGDLVTMRWFDDLWLKEGFSTFMAARMQEALNPGTGAWKTFYLRNKPSAYLVDATRGTTPVWQALDNLDLAKSNYGPIVYNKAPAILKQLELWVGEENFRRGLRHLLTTHSFGSITWRDLLASLEEVSGQPLGSFGEHYVLRAGMPVVETVLTTRGGRIHELRLIQRPARELEGDSGRWWPGRVRVRLGYAEGADTVIPVSFAGDTTLVREAAGLPAPRYVFANDGDFGYGVFLLDQASAAALAEGVGDIEDDLLRALAWGALWDLVGERRMTPEAMLELVARELPRETDDQIAEFLLARSTRALTRLLPPASVAAEIRGRFERLLEARAENPALTYDLRKASLDALIGIARTPRSLEFLEELLAERRLFEGAPLRQPSRWAAVETLVALGHPRADSIFAAERARDDGAEAERRAFVTRAAFPTALAKEEHFRRLLRDAELNEEWATASLGALNHPEHSHLTLPLLRPALERLQWIQQNRRIFFLQQWINAFIGGQRSAEALAVVDGYLADHPSLPPDLRRKVLQARDELERTVLIRG